MKCDIVKELLPFIDDGSIDQETVKEVKTHLEKCEECRKENNEIQFVVNLARTALSEHKALPSLEFLENVQMKIDKEKRARKVHKWMFSAAAVFIAISFTLYGILTMNVTKTVPYQMVIIEPDEEFYTYYAESYLDTYEFLELVNGVETNNESQLQDELLNSDYLDVSLYDIIETFDTNEITNIFSLSDK